MKKILFLSVALLAVLACNFVVAAPGKHIKGNGVKVEKSYDLDSFNAVKVNGSTDVVFSQGPPMKTSSTFSKSRSMTVF